MCLCVNLRWFEPLMPMKGAWSHFAEDLPNSWGCSMSRKSILCFVLLLLCGKGEQPVLAGDVSIRGDVVYGHKAGMALTFDVIQPENPNGAGILYMVSGGWVSFWIPPQGLVRAERSTPNWFEVLIDHGYTIFVVRHGSSPYFKVPDAVADVRRAVRFIRLHAADFNVDPNRLGVFGASAGGHLSLMLGTASDTGNPQSADPVERVSNRVQAVVAIFPPTRIDEFFKLKEQFPALDFPVEKADSVSPLLHVSSDDPPTLLIHGDKDELVPIDQSERIEAAFRNAKVPTELMVVPGAGHSFNQKEQIQAQNRMLEWFNTHLAKPE